MGEEELPVGFAEGGHEDCEEESDGATGYWYLIDHNTLAASIYNHRWDWRLELGLLCLTVGPYLSASSPATGANPNKQKMENDPSHAISKSLLLLSKVLR